MRSGPASLAGVVGRERDAPSWAAGCEDGRPRGLRGGRARRTPPVIAEKLGGAASVAVVKATDLRQGDNATEFGLFDCARFR